MGKAFTKEKAIEVTLKTLNNAVVQYRDLKDKLSEATHTQEGFWIWAKTKCSMYGGETPYGAYPHGTNCRDCYTLNGVLGSIREDIVEMADMYRFANEAEADETVCIDDDDLNIIEWYLDDSEEENDGD